MQERLLMRYKKLDKVGFVFFCEVRVFDLLIDELIQFEQSRFDRTEASRLNRMIDRNLTIMSGDIELFTKLLNLLDHRLLLHSFLVSQLALENLKACPVYSVNKNLLQLTFFVFLDSRFTFCALD